MGNCMPCLVHDQPKRRSKSALVVPVAYHADQRAAEAEAAADARGKATSSSEGSKKEEEDAAAVRIRIVMSKKEAAQMLSLLAGGCQRLAPEKKAAGVVRGAKGRRKPQYGGRGCCWKPVLAGIPEEEEEEEEDY